MSLRFRILLEVWEVFAFKDSGLHLRTQGNRMVDELTAYYTPVQAFGAEMSNQDQAVSASGQSRTPKCSQASIRAVAASRVLASSRRS